jgi:hypothetical protein
MRGHMNVKSNMHHGWHTRHTTELELWNHHCWIFGCKKIEIWTNTYKGKGKAIRLQAKTGPQGSRRLRLPDFMTVGTGRLALWTGRIYPQGNIPGWVVPRTIARPEGLCQLKIRMTTIGNRTRNLPACRAVLQSTVGLHGRLWGELYLCCFILYWN